MTELPDIASNQSNVTRTKLPTDPKDLTVDLLNDVIRGQSPEIALTDFAIAESHAWGSGHASSAGRIVIEPCYATPSSDLPRHIVIKVARTDPVSSTRHQAGRAALYANEVNIYTRFKPSKLVEAPVAFGGAYDPQSYTFLLLLEDLRDRNATFANVTIPTSLDRMRSLLDMLARLHARYWNSPELTSSLAWMETHTSGPLYEMFNAPDVAPRAIAYLVESVQFKREMVQRLGTTADGLFQGLQLVQQHQARLPQTVCHGDTHIGNTYIIPDDRGGLIDWQLACQGFAIHDVSYLLATGLSVAERRVHERELLAYYREQLTANGVEDAPSLEEFWLEYRRAMIWGVYIGWLTTPVENYGWDITIMNHLRVMTAFEDLETKKLIDALR